MKRDYHQLASSFYLCETLPDDWNDWDEDKYNAFLTDYAWEPFEYHDIHDVHEHILNLADMFAHVAKEARDET
jgi:hypothetical protein